MIAYSLARRLSHADVDFLGELKVAALLGLLEQAAVEASAAAGFDAARYSHDGRMWIIRRTRLARTVPVGGSDVLEVQTRVLDFRRARSLRGYTVRREATVVAEATTDWVYCDALTGRPARIPDELQQALAGAAVPLPRAAALIVAPPAEAATAAVRVEPSHLDHVVHVNNAVYASFLEDAAQALFAGHGWPLPRMLGAGGALRAGALDIEYVNDAQLHDDLVVRSWLPQRGSLGMRDGHPHTAEVLQQIARADGTEIVRAHSQWVWRWKPAVVGGVPTL